MTSQQSDQWRLGLLLLLLLATVAVGAIIPSSYQSGPNPVVVNAVPHHYLTIDAGTVLSRVDEPSLSVDQVQVSSHQDYGRFTIKAKYGVARSLISYRSYDTDGTPLTIFARVYQPIGVSGVPILGFAPGTTGIGDACAASLEIPQVASWANYESHMLTYAGQGYATVITDYEGMRDPGRLHHYMVGQLEGRAVLDSVRALIRLDGKSDQLNTKAVFLAGYSQGGHAALWADEIAASYAPELKLSGIIGFGAVVSVEETLADVTHGSNLDWFGPYVLVSYADYYHETYALDQILQPKYRSNLTADVTNHCINTDVEFWGTDPAAVYMPPFIKALQTHTLDTSFPDFAKRLHQNAVGAIATKTPKLLNGGTKDIVVLPQQQTNALTKLCSNPTAPVHLHEYPEATHYNTMAVSIVDVLSWMKTLQDNGNAPNDCHKIPLPGN